MTNNTVLVNRCLGVAEDGSIEANSTIAARLSRGTAELGAAGSSEPQATRVSANEAPIILEFGRVIFLLSYRL